MEILNPFSKTDEVAEAIRGAWGKDCGEYMGKPFKLIYCGQVIFGLGEKNVLEKKCSVSHYDWEEIGSNVYLAVVK